MGVGGTLQISWMPLQELAGACPRSLWAVPRGLFTIGPYGSGGYIADLLDAITGTSWGPPKESLGSAQVCVGILVRGLHVLSGSCRVP